MPQGDVTPEGCDRPTPPQGPETFAGRHQPRDPVTTAGSSTEVRCTKTALVRAAELQVKAKVVAPAVSGPLRTKANYATTLREALNTVQQRHQTQAPATGQAMEQDDALSSAAPSDQEEQEAGVEGEVIRPPQGQGAYGCIKDTSRRSSIDRPVKAVAKSPMENGSASRRGTCTSRAGGEDHAPP